MTALKSRARLENGKAHRRHSFKSDDVCNDALKYGMETTGLDKSNFVREAILQWAVAHQSGDVEVRRVLMARRELERTTLEMGQHLRTLAACYDGGIEAVMALLKPPGEGV